MEIRSLANLHAAMLEDEASAAEMLPDVTTLASRESVWHKAKFRRLMQPGSLVKVHAPTRITAASEISDLIQRFDAFGDSPVSAMAEPILSLLYGRHLGIRVFPCGPGVPEKAFTGLFADVDDYIGQERPLLIPRFGSDTPELTCVLQVTRASAQVGRTQPITRHSFDDLMADISRTPERVDRGVLELFLQRMLEMLEGSGMLEAPQWPAIGVLPLAIYRNVAPVRNFIGIEEQLTRG